MSGIKTICSSCRFEIHPSDGIAYMGICLRHRNQERCCQLLLAEIDRLKIQLNKLLSAIEVDECA